MTDWGLPLGDARLTVGVLLDRWLEQRRRSDKAANTIAQYEWAINGHLKPALGRIRLVQLTAEHVEHLLEERAADPPMARNSMSGSGRCWPWPSIRPSPATSSPATSSSWP